MKMNILFISCCNGNKSSGLTYSVPAQIKSATKYDNIFWYNLLPVVDNEWKEERYYHTIIEYPKKSLNELPEPFNNPDLVVFQQMYDYLKYNKLRILREIMKKKIPYIIIPRSELTKLAQKKSKLKKLFFNKLFFNKFVKSAVSIQYLTEAEKYNSDIKWNENYFINSNGIRLPLITKKNFSDNKVVCSFIGRIEPYQKGIDLLIDACFEIKEKLIERNVYINIYGPLDDKEKKIEELIKKYKLEKIIKINDPIHLKEKEKVLLNTDVFILTSRFEGHSMGLIEALAYGIPCLVTEGTNLKKEIEDYNAGWTSETTVLGIKEALLNMIKDMEKFKEKGKNAIILSKNYDWDFIAKKSHEQYKKIKERKIR